MRLPTAWRVFILVTSLAIAPSVSYAEFTRVELKIFGMDCATCAHGVRVGIQKIDGVESVELSLEKASADIRLRPENHVSLEQFRQLIKLNGFAPKEAVVTARGIVIDRGGKPALEITGAGNTVLIVSADKSTPAAYKQLSDILARKSAASIEIAGTVQKRNDGTDEIVLTSVKEGSK